MAVKCDKCLKRRNRASVSMQGGKTYSFCADCTEDLKNFTPTSIELFIHETWVSKNIRKAKERRAKGQSLWAKRASL